MGFKIWDKPSILNLLILKVKLWVITILAQRLMLKKIIEAMPDPVFIKGLGGEFVHCNSLFAGMLGSDKDSPIGPRD